MLMRSTPEAPTIRLGYSGASGALQSWVYKDLFNAFWPEPAEEAGSAHAYRTTVTRDTENTSLA